MDEASQRQSDQTAGGHSALLGLTDDESTASGGKRPPDLAAALREVEVAAREWGIRPELLEGRFISALMVALETSGRLSLAANVELRQMFTRNRDAAELELAHAKEITRAGEVVLRQARSAQLAAQAVQDEMVARMVKDTMPAFVDKLQNALVIREVLWNDQVKRRRYALAGVVTMALFLGGYMLRAVEGVRAEPGLSQCLANTTRVNDRLYCDVTALVPSRLEPSKP